jgi:hypothetical protein
LPAAFTGLDKEKSWGQSQPITAGQYLLRIKQFRMHESVDPQKNKSVFFFAICEVTFVEYKDGQDPKYEVGAEISWAINMSKPNGKNTLIQFLLHLFEDEKLPQESLTDAFVASVFEPDFRGLGREMIANAYDITIASTGKPFTKVEWHLYQEQAAATDEATPVADASETDAPAAAESVPASAVLA